MKSQLTTFYRQIGQSAKPQFQVLTLAVYPYLIEFTKDQPLPTTIYFQKGSQVLNANPKSVVNLPSSLSLKKHNLSSADYLVLFKLYSLDNILYKWSLYHTQNQQLMFSQSVNFDLREIAQKFMQDKKLQDILFNHLKKQQLKCVFQNSGVVVHFLLFVSNDAKRIQSQIEHRNEHKQTPSQQLNLPDLSYQQNSTIPIASRKASQRQQLKSTSTNQRFLAYNSYEYQQMSINSKIKSKTNKSSSGSHKQSQMGSSDQRFLAYNSYQFDNMPAPAPKNASKKTKPLLRNKSSQIFNSLLNGMSQNSPPRDLDDLILNPFYWKAQKQQKKLSTQVPAIEIIAPKTNPSQSQQKISQNIANNQENKSIETAKTQQIKKQDSQSPKIQAKKKDDEQSISNFSAKLPQPDLLKIQSYPQGNKNRIPQPIAKLDTISQQLSSCKQPQISSFKPPPQETPPVVSHVSVFSRFIMLVSRCKDNQLQFDIKKICWICFLILVIVIMGGMLVSKRQIYKSPKPRKTHKRQ